MIVLKFHSRRDELKFFLLINVIQDFAETPIRYAECVNDLDLCNGYKDTDQED